MPDSRSIGVFDSGLGGLTVVSAIRQILPQENIIYLGDTARVPYGNRSPETIRSFAADDMAYLAGQNVKMVIAACNTVSATALDFLQEKYPEIPVLGVIEAGAAAAAAAAKKKLLVLGTRATVGSGAYTRALLKSRTDLEICSRACPLFVPLAEEGILSGTVVQETLKLYLDDILADTDTILLGCTHYPLLAHAIRTFTGGKITIIDSAAATASVLQKFLTENGLGAEPTASGTLKITVTDISGGFQTQAERFLGTALPPITTAVWG